ncbi:probable receptor-like protein kinase At1g49730 [Typha latifolia]|uniref:probable receptor-like protein kinase At1g49730 n=1 Tax=Typha latifolia TaxID=4733 RepID=UPI003C2B9C1B
MLGAVLGFVVVVAAGLLESSILSVIAGDCPLDLSWLNYTLVASACSDQNERAKCCRYINALVAVSVSKYANTTGMLGVPPEFSDACLSNVSDTLISNGIPSNAILSCGLGVKVQVFYQCEGRNTVLEMLQSPNFDDVTRSCNLPLSIASSCKKCLNSGLSYLRHLIGAQDNITLNTCRDAAFVALANQGNNLSAVELTSCFFSVQGLSIIKVNSSEPSSFHLAPASSPSPYFVQAPAENLTAIPLKGHHSYRLTLIPGIGIMVTGLAVLLLIILMLLIRRKNRELETKGTHAEDSWNTSSSLHDQEGQEGKTAFFNRFSFKEMKKATGNFSTIFGRGGNSIIYKGQFDDSSIVAVKRIDNLLKQGKGDFCREMEFLGRLHHRHLVALRGFCFTKYERFLVYEYMENGSLKDHLHSSDRPPLTWKARIHIAIDVANALEYLHFYCDPSIFHGDIKPSNILLDKNFLAKVADFGLARFSRSGNMHLLPVDTKIQGTPGYIDPEYVATQELTAKSDVYSYGILLLELLTGKPAIYEGKTLVEWSQDLIATESPLEELVDPAITESFNLEELHVLVDVIHWCTQKEGRTRPSMKQVLRMLYERLDPTHSCFAQAIEDEEGYCGGQRTSKGKAQQSEVIPFSGDARCLQSSSSTSRSYCSRSVLLESNSPESPHGIFSV